MAKKKEVWRPIPGYEGFYEASTEGRIRSVSREVARAKGSSTQHDGQVLSPTMSVRGILQVRLSAENQRALHTVARLVLSTFDSAPEEGDYAAHLDRDQTNTRPDNLQWMSRSELYAHMKGDD